MDTRPLDPNPFLLQRLGALRSQFVSAYRGGSHLSSATKGRERESFIQSFLEQLFPNSYRFGSGDITDTTHYRTGQMDLVVEFPFLPSFPAVAAPGMPRLYLAESVAAVIEVKSDLAGQWSEVVAAAERVSQLTLRRGNSLTTITDNRERPNGVPVFAVGYSGWKTQEALQSHCQDAKVWGAWVIDSGLYNSVNVHGRGEDLAPLLFCDDLMHCMRINRVDGSQLLEYAYKV